MIRAPLPTSPPSQKQAKAGPRGARGKGHIPRGSAAGPRGARAGGCGKRARAREAGAEALGRAAAGARHRRSRAAAAAAAPGPASPRQHRSLFTSPGPAALPPSRPPHAPPPPPPPASALPPAPLPARSSLSLAPAAAAAASERAAGRAHAASLPPSPGWGPIVPPRRGRRPTAAPRPSPRPYPARPAARDRRCARLRPRCGTPRAPVGVGAFPEPGVEGKDKKSRRDGVGGRGGHGLFFPFLHLQIFLVTSQPCFLAWEVKSKLLGWPRRSAPGTHPLGGSDARGSAFVVRSALTPLALEWHLRQLARAEGEEIGHGESVSLLTCALGRSFPL